MRDFEYAVKVLEGGGYRRFDVCRLGISVGQPYHEGGKLRAATAWARARFPRVIVSVADTLQRHNGLTTAEARAEGDAWLARNAASLEGFEIQRWDDWLHHTDYPPVRAAVDRLYTKHAGFRADIDGAAATFVARRGGTATSSREYLLEETAVLAIQQQAVPAVDVYPGTVMGLWDRFRREPVANAPVGLSGRHFTRIAFTRK